MSAVETTLPMAGVPAVKAVPPHPLAIARTERRSAAATLAEPVFFTGARVEEPDRVA
jgi:hypothetical protein